MISYVMADLSILFMSLVIKSDTINKEKYRIYWNDIKQSIYLGSMMLMTLKIINEIMEKSGDYT